MIYSRSVEQSHEQFYYAYMDCKSKRQHVTRLLKTLLYMLFLIMIQLDSSLLCFLFFLKQMIFTCMIILSHCMQRVLH